MSKSNAIKSLKTSGKTNTLTYERAEEQSLDFSSQCQTEYNAKYVLEQAKRELSTVKGLNSIEPASPIYKALTLFEFELGTLLTSAVPERFKVFALDLSKKLQTEYHCQSVSERATAELIALNFTRTLQIQSRISAYLNLESISELGVKYLAILSKELDRANRHYLTSVQTLKAMKQPQIEVNIRATTAVVGQNQIVQANTNDKGI